MGDSRRFEEFSKIVEKHISKISSIVDVAGGKGYLQACLRERGFTKVTTVDKRKKNSLNKKGHKYSLFDYRTSEKFDAVVAMHPDEGTDHAIMYASLHKIPAVICPCCVKPSAATYWGNHKFDSWKKHLQNLAEKYGMTVQWTKMKINGKNEVMILKP